MNKTLALKNAQTTEPLWKLTNLFPAVVGNNWFDELFSETSLNKAFDLQNAHYPYNVGHVYEDEEQTKLKATFVEIALAGIGRENIDVKVVDNSLVIAIEHEDKKDSKRVVSRRGLSARKAKYEFRLTDYADAENIKSTYKDGLLTVEIPTVQPKTVNIKVNVD